MKWIDSRRIQVASVGIAFMWVCGLAERAISVSDVIPHVWGDGIAVIGVLGVAITAHLVFAGLDIRPALRNMLRLAWLLFFIYTLSDFFDEFLFPPENPILGRRQPLHILLEIVLWSMALALMILTLFAIAIESSEARKSAKLEREKGEDATRERQRTQERLALFHYAIQQARDAIVVMGLDDTILFANEALHTLLGLPPGTAIGQRAAQLNTSVDVEHETMISAARDSGTWTGKLEARRSDGSPIFVDVGVTVFRDEMGTLAGIVAIARDVTEQRRVAAALSESEERYRLLAEHATDLISTHTRNGHWLYISPSVRNILGYEPEELLGQTAYDLMDPQIAAMLDASDPADFVNDRPTPFRVRMRHKLGHYVDVETSLRTITPYDHADNAQILSISRDITPRLRQEEEGRQLKQKLQRAQRHESLALLAGGVAHDFNNLLLIVLASSDLLNLDIAALNIPKDSQAGNHVRQIQIAAERAADLTRQMLKYAGQGNVEIQRIDIGAIVEEMASLLEATVPKRIRIERSKPDDIASFMGDITELRQVLLNLITNASEAIGSKDGTIRISTGIMRCDRKYLGSCATHDDLPEGRYAYIDVRDDGCGMDEATRDRMFDPFFTTKFQGRGLGLAAVMGIVLRHSGTMHIESTLGSGTAIRVLFPIDPIPPMLRHEIAFDEPPAQDSN